MTDHNLDKTFGVIPESLQIKGECIICKTKAKEGYLICNECLKKYK